MQTDTSRRGVLASHYSERKSHCSDEPQVQTEQRMAKLACYSKNPTSLLRKYAILTLLEHETLDIKGEQQPFWRGSKEGRLREHFRGRKHLENLISLKILPKIKGSRLRIQAQARFFELSGLFPAISYLGLLFPAIF